jgi:parallel beta-helix repeat protein
MNLFFRLCFLIICIASIAPHIYAVDYYVSPTGLDTNSGTKAAPFRLVQTGINKLQPGDSLFLRAGTYSEKISFPRSGLVNQPISVSGYSGETAVIDGTNQTVNSGDGLVKIMGLGYINISHLTIQNSNYVGLYVSAYFVPTISTHHLNFADLTVLNSRDAAIKVIGGSYINVTNSTTRESGSSGIGIWNSDHVFVDHNKVINARNIATNLGGHEECISIASTHDFEVSNNEVYYEGITGFLGGAGIDVKESSYTGTVHHNNTHDIINDGGIYLDAWTAGSNGTPTLHDIKVYNNKTYQCGGISIGSEQGGTVENIDIYNNIVIRSSYAGILMHNTGGNGLRKNINIYNNTIYQSTANGGSGIYIATSNIENIVIKNNLVAFDPKWVGQITLADPNVVNRVTADHNITYGRKLCSNAFPNCYNFSDINTDPQFVDPANLNLKLQSTSPARDAGVNTNITSDYSDATRPQGSGYDIGAYEYTVTTSPTIYYVATNGKDSNTGTQAAPFLTVQKAVDKVVNPGDQIIVAPGDYKFTGTYQYGKVAEFLNKHGTPGNNIILKAQDPNHRPRFFGFSGISVTASSYITIDGFEILDTTFSGIPLVLSDHISVKNNYIHFHETGFCTSAISLDTNNPYHGCTVGDLIGRLDKNGNPLIENDGHQNPGIYMCKSINSIISGNTIENADESIYMGTAGNVTVDDCAYPQANIVRTWSEGNIIENNYIINSWNEGIELKPDARNNIIRDNVLRNTRTNVESSLIEIRGHKNEISGNIVVGAPNIAIRSVSETVADPGVDRIEAYKNTDGSYKSGYENYIHHNFIYYWSENIANGIGINSHDKAAADKIEHNTIVGTNQFSGAISEYYSIKSNSIPNTVVKDNLMVGIRRYDYTTGSVKYEGHLTSYASLLPIVSDYNAYYPKTKDNNSTCIVNLGALGIICQTNNAHNQSVGFEYNSKFLDSSPIHSDETICAKPQLLTIPMESLTERIKYCSSPVASSTILNSASDDTNIGAWQGTITQPTNSPSVTLIPTKPGDANNDQIIDGRDYVVWLNHYGQNLTGVNNGNFNEDNIVDGRDYVVWLNNYGK